MENDSQYTYIVPANTANDIALPSMLEMLPGKWGEYIRRWYLFKNLPVDRQELKILDVRGQKLILPYTYESLKAFGKEEITNILNRIIMREDVQNIVVEKKLEPYLDESLLIDGRLTHYLLIREGINWAMRKHGIDAKNFNPIVMDSGDSDTEYVLSQIGQDLNFLTIVTRRPAFFEPYAEETYAKTGLMASILEKPLYGELTGNVVLDLCMDEDKDYQYYPRHAIVLDLTGSSKKRRDILAKRKDISYYNRFDVAVDGKVIDGRLLQAVICGECTWLSKCELESMRREIQDFPLKIRRLGIQTFA